MGNRILIVEDEPLIAADLNIMLQKEGYNVVCIAHEGSVALDLLYNQSPDLALLDVALDSSMSGFDIAKIINEKYRIPFIFITSFSDKYTLDKAKEVEPAGFIVKPFKKKNVCANVELALHRKYAQSNSIFLSLEKLNLKFQQPISEKEYELIMDIAKGKTNQELCDKHFISVNTVKTHLKRIFAKLGVSNRTQMVAKVFREDKY